MRTDCIGSCKSNYHKLTTTPIPCNQWETKNTSDVNPTDQ